VNDEELIDETLNGNREAFCSLALKYQDRVYNLALPIVGNHDDALDVVQETFLQALAHLETFRRTSRFYTWLYRIAYNCAIGTLRRRKKTVSVDVVSEEFGVSFEADVDAPDANLRRKDLAKALKVALAKLPLEYREAIVLREIYELDYEQIAERLKAPVGTVRSRLHRARASLRKALERQGFADRAE